MPALVQNFSPRTIGELVQFAMEFGPNLAPGETLVTSAWAVSLKSGTPDPNVAARAVGPATVAGTIGACFIDCGLALSGITSGNIYLLVCTVTTTTGETLIGSGTVQINAPVVGTG